MKNRWIALIAMSVLATGCARGGEGDEGAALTDTASSATIVGDTSGISPMTTTAPAPAAPVAAPATDSAPAETTDSTAAPAVHADSAAH